jgi:hypothetical protein
VRGLVLTLTSCPNRGGCPIDAGTRGREGNRGRKEPEDGRTGKCELFSQ